MAIIKLATFAWYVGFFISTFAAAIDLTISHVPDLPLPGRLLKMEFEVKRQLEVFIHVLLNVAEAEHEL